MIEFLNMFLVPFISLGIIVKRDNISKQLSFDLVMLFAGMAVANAVGVFFVMQLIKALVGIYAYPNSQTYTIVAAVVAVIVPFVREVVKKNAEISVEIGKKD